MRRKALSQELDELELELLELWFQEPTRLAPPCRVSHRTTAVPLVARFTNRGDLRDQTSGHPGAPVISAIVVGTRFEPESRRPAESTESKAQGSAETGSKHGGVGCCAIIFLVKREGRGIVPKRPSIGNCQCPLPLHLLGRDLCRRLAAVTCSGSVFSSATRLLQPPRAPWRAGG